MLVRNVDAGDRNEWLRMRRALWPETEDGEAEIIDAFLAGRKALGLDAAFVAVRESGGLGGFIEISVRPYANGCSASPVGFIEGWYVDSDLRRQGVGASLVQAAEEWACEQGLTEVGSDTDISNETSRRAHISLGYEEKERAVCFCKRLK